MRIFSLFLCLFLLSACAKSSGFLVQHHESSSVALSATNGDSASFFVGPPEPKNTLSVDDRYDSGKLDTQRQSREIEVSFVGPPKPKEIGKERVASNKSHLVPKRIRFIDDRYGPGKLGPRILSHDEEVSSVEPARISLILESVMPVQTDAEKERRTVAPRTPKLVRIFRMRDARSAKRAGDVFRAYTENANTQAFQLFPPPPPPPNFVASTTLFRSWIPRRTSIPWCEWESIIVDAGHVFGLDPVFIAAMIKTESNFDHRAVSHAGARGAMQIMPETQKELGLSDPFDARANVFAGCRFIRSLLIKYNSTELALAAYNAGPFAVEKARGVPPYKETRNFIQRILHLWQEVS